MIRTLRIALVAALALASIGVCAQLRSIPVEAKRGVFSHLQEMMVQINGRRMLLAPGAQIRDAGNRVMLPAAVPAGALVKFTVDAQGNLSRVWVLSAQEAAQPDPRR